MKKVYSIIWKTFQAKSELGIHLGAKKDFSLPYFVDGLDKDKIDKGIQINLSEIHLLQGLLLGYFDNPPTMDLTYSRTLFPDAIEDMRKYFDFETTEKLILDISSYIRKENGDHASYLALKTGLILTEDNSKIRFDFCVDLYNMLERNNYENRAEGINLLKESLGQISTDKIRPEFIVHLKQFQEFIENENVAEK